MSDTEKPAMKARKRGRPKKERKPAPTIPEGMTRAEADRWIRDELDRCTSDLARVAWGRILLELHDALGPQLPARVPSVPDDPILRAKLRLGQVRKHIQIERGRILLDYMAEERRLLADIARLVDGKGERTTPAEEATGLTDDELDAAIEEARRRGHPGVVPA